MHMYNVLLWEPTFCAANLPKTLCFLENVMYRVRMQTIKNIPSVSVNPRENVPFHQQLCRRGNLKHTPAIQTELCFVIVILLFIPDLIKYAGLVYRTYLGTTHFGSALKYQGVWPFLVSTLAYLSSLRQRGLTTLTCTR